MKVYASPNSACQTVVADGVDYQPAADEVLMTTTRPAGDHKAADDGTWVMAAAPEPVTVSALFAILPVNDGNPVTTASQYTLVNPFPGYYVSCQAEFMYNDNDVWMSMTWNNNNGSGAHSEGISACQNPNALDTIVVNISNGFPYDSSPTRIVLDLSVPVNQFPTTKPSSVRVRVKVWTIAKATDVRGVISMSYDKATDLPLIQADVLTTDMSSNANVTNLKQLKTETKTPTKAINALNEQLDNAQTSAADAVAKVVALEQTVAHMQTVIDQLRATIAADDDAFLQRNCVYVYPNGGTAEHPAHIKTGQIYTMPNPFPGYLVQCQVEVCIGTEWSLLTTGQYYTGSRYNSGGALCAQRDDELVLVVGNCHVVDGGGDEGYYCHVFFYTFTENKTYPSGQSYDNLPCRVRVWRVGKR